MRFLTAYSTRGDALRAVEDIVRQLDAQRSRPDTVTRPNLGLVYGTEAHGENAAAVLQALRARTGIAHWAGGTGIGVAVDGHEYLDEPALAVMLLQFRPRDFRVFSGRQPLPQAGGAWRGAYSALVHGDADEPDIDELVQEQAARLRGAGASGGRVGGLVGGLVPPGGVQIADAVLRGGLSGVAFSSRVALSQGLSVGGEACGPERTVTACAGGLLRTLDGRGALQLLLEDLGVAKFDVMGLRGVAVALSGAGGGFEASRRGFDADMRLSPLVGVDVAGGGLALNVPVESGARVRFFRRDAQLAQRDLVRMCTEVREELEQRRAARIAATQDLAQTGPGAPWTCGARGAIYVSCAGRSSALFGAPGVELETVRRHLGDVPLIGFFGAGEFAGPRVHSGCGVLTVFGDDPLA